MGVKRPIFSCSFSKTVALPHPRNMAKCARRGSWTRASFVKSFVLGVPQASFLPGEPRRRTRAHQLECERYGKPLAPSIELHHDHEPRGVLNVPSRSIDRFQCGPRLPRGGGGRGGVGREMPSRPAALPIEKNGSFSPCTSNKIIILAHVFHAVRPAFLPIKQRNGS